MASLIVMRFACRRVLPKWPDSRWKAKEAFTEAQKLPKNVDEALKFELQFMRRETQPASIVLRRLGPCRQTDIGSLPNRPPV
jgi:hypothetical protein